MPNDPTPAPAAARPTPSDPATTPSEATPGVPQSAPLVQAPLPPANPSLMGTVQKGAELPKHFKRG